MNLVFSVILVICSFVNFRNLFFAHEKYVETGKSDSNMFWFIIAFGILGVATTIMSIGFLGAFLHIELGVI